MKSYPYLFIFLSICTFSFSIQGQDYWSFNQEVGGILNSSAYKMKQTEDRGSLAVGKHNSRFFIRKFSQQGDVEWLYEDDLSDPLEAGDEIANDLTQLGQHYFVSLNLNWQDSLKSTILKFDLDGNIIQSYDYIGENISFIKTTFDQELMFLLRDPSSKQGRLLKMDQDFVVSWEKTIGTLEGAYFQNSSFLFNEKGNLVFCHYESSNRIIFREIAMVNGDELQKKELDLIHEPCFKKLYLDQIDKFKYVLGFDFCFQEERPFLLFLDNNFNSTSQFFAPNHDEALLDITALNVINKKIYISYNYSKYLILDEFGEVIRKSDLAYINNDSMFFGITALNFEQADDNTILLAGMGFGGIKTSIFCARMNENLTMGNTTALNTFFPQESINIFPNPTSDYLNIDLTNDQLDQQVVFELLDYTGKTIQYIPQNKIKIDVSWLPSNLYYLKIISPNKYIILPFLKL